tara:strand:- start:53 stop:694 length:642 start_codon:yes stop_codon:yes gene_type:complete
MMFFVGCSFTMGTELENPEKERFSSLVADRFQVDHLNRAEAGLSNDGILRKTIKYCEKGRVDFAVIQLTKYSRREILDIRKPLPEQSPYFRLNVSNPKKAVKEYFAKLSTSEDDIANFYKNKFLLEFYLNAKKIPYYFLQLSDPSIKYTNYGHFFRSSWQKLTDTPVECIYNILEGDEFSGSPFYTSSERPHPNALGHRKIADHIIENLKGVF